MVCEEDICTGAAYMNPSEYYAFHISNKNGLPPPSPSSIYIYIYINGKLRCNVAVLSGYRQGFALDIGFIEHTLNL
jgi:hypothetical protein